MEEIAQQNRKTIVQAFDSSSYDKVLAIHKVKYGVTVLKLTSGGKAGSRRIYLQEYNKGFLQWISPSKSLYKSRLNILQVHKIEIGGRSSTFLKFRGNFDINSSVTLYYSNKSLNLIFPQPEEMMLWVSGVQFLIEELNKESSSKLQENLMDQAWSNADKNNSGNLNIEEIKFMMKSLNLFISDEDVEKLFKEFDQDNSGHIEKEEFKKMLELLMQKPEIDDLFAKFAVGKEYMDLEEFKSFCEQIQGPTSNAEEIFEFFIESRGEEKRFTLDSFKNYVLNPVYNSLIRSEEKKVNMEMNHPLAHYFIASSHNTYLEGNQLTGNSSIEMYSKVLLAGCRCVEIDSWDGDSEPMVTHGHTFVSKLKLREVTEEIKKSAFITSPYPVIISLENHCSRPQTEKIGLIFREILGDMIYKPAGSMKTPELLQYKFIIKAKLSNTHDPDKNSSKPPEPVPSSLGGIVGIIPGVFSLTQMYNSIVSLSEKKLKNLIKLHKSARMIQYHCKSFSRIYPKGTRINSSNYDPILAWCHGAQVVAINYQSFDLGGLLNHCFFKLNGSCGYLLKPEILRNLTKLVNFESERINSSQLTLKVEIISGSNLPKSANNETIISPYIELSIIGIPNDCCSYSTRVITKNGFNPVWKEIFTFSIKFPQVCFLLFKVFSKSAVKSTEIGQTAIPVYYIRAGYRILELLDSRFEPFNNSFLLLRTSFE